jgi:hypothetical protein
MRPENTLMNRAKLDQRMEQATREVDRTRKEWLDAKPPDKPRLWDLHQRAINRMNAAITAANQRPVRAPIFGADEDE